MRGLFCSLRTTLRRLGLQAAAVGALTLTSSVMLESAPEARTTPQAPKALFSSKWPVETASAAAEGSLPHAASAPPSKDPAVSDSDAGGSARATRYEWAW
jgi:hypothetical protein